MRKIILGTDWWTDCDDCVALRLLSNAHKNREIELVGVGINACMPFSAPSLSAFLTAEGLEDIPIGIDLEATDFEGDYFKYQEPLAAYPHSIKSNNDCENAVDMYRRILKSSDEKVYIVEVGFNQVLSALMQNDDDLALLKSKVECIYSMAGEWDKEIGSEHNFNNNHRSRLAGHILCEKSPVPIIFVGFEVGKDILTGDGLPEGDLLKLAVTLHGSENGRMSWDPLTALLAVIGDLQKAGYQLVKGKAYVDPQNGENSFAKGEGFHYYVVKTQPDCFYRSEIQRRIQPNI